MSRFREEYYGTAAFKAFQKEKYRLEGCACGYTHPAKVRSPENSLEEGIRSLHLRKSPQVRQAVARAVQKRLRDA